MSNIPGSNLLNAALTVIAKQTISYYRYVERVLNDVGQNITTYAAPVPIVGSFQPVPRRMYTQMGLDMQKAYYTFYTSNNILDISRDVAGDQIVFQGKRYQCQSNNDWYAGLDGWKGVLCVYIEDVDTLVFGFNRTPSINANVNFNRGTYVEDGGN